MRVLVTRARGDAERTAARLRAQGHEALIAPLMEIVPTNVAIPNEVFDAVLATSVHALTFVERLPPALKGAPWLVVGERLAELLGERAWELPEVCAPDVAALIVAMDELYPEPFRFLYLAGRDRKPDLERAMRARRHELVTVETYAADVVAHFDADAEAALCAGGVDAVLHFSRRSAELFVAAAGDARNLRHIVISADAAAPLVAKGWPVAVAAAPSEEAMLALLA